jgi:hypothetical protein
VFGVVHDRRERTYTAVLALRGESVALLAPEEKERRIAGWSAVLASLARERSVVHRLAWLATSLPDDGRAVRFHLDEHGVLGPTSPARRSYERLLAAAGTGTSRHEVLLCVQVKAIRGTVGERSTVATSGVLWRELVNLRRLLSEADAVVAGVLGPSDVAAVVRRAGDASPSPLAHGGDGDAGDIAKGTGCAGRDDRTLVAGPRPVPGGATWPWPMATEVEWGCLRTDGTWHATYWIAEWPRVEVGPDFLAPLLLGPVRRSVAVTMEPISPRRAVRQVEQARTADLADSELRRRGGFLATARRAREAEVVSRRETELADGHASFRFSGYVTVTAPDRARLDEACAMTEQAAGQCRLEIRRLWGEQERAFTCTLPLARGLG